MLLSKNVQSDVNSICAALEEYSTSRDPRVSAAKPLSILPLYRQLPRKKQVAAILPAANGCRKIVVATDIAETSLTIEGITIVIDMGLVNRVKYEQRTGFYETSKIPISQGSAAQRAGRAGRTAPGSCYRLYTQREYR